MSDNQSEFTAVVDVSRHVLSDTYDNIVFTAMHAFKARGDSRLWEWECKASELKLLTIFHSLIKELDANYLPFFLLQILYEGI